VISTLQLNAFPSSLETLLSRPFPTFPYSILHHYLCTPMTSYTPGQHLSLASLGNHVFKTWCHLAVFSGAQTCTLSLSNALNPLLMGWQWGLVWLSCLWTTINVLIFTFNIFVGVP
jgi:hypothetical protein